MPPCKLNHLVVPAQALVTEIQGYLPITSAILDDWGGGPRIIWGGPAVEACAGDCESCPLFQVVGEDPEDTSDRDFTTTLVRADEEQLAVFSVKQPMLNCKTLQQYLDAFVEWFVQRCRTTEQVRDEMLWVAGFRLLYFQDCSPAGLLQLEHLARRYVVNTAMFHLLASGDDTNNAERIRALHQEAERLGIL